MDLDVLFGKPRCVHVEWKTFPVDTVGKRSGEHKNVLHSEVEGADVDVSSLPVCFVCVPLRRGMEKTLCLQ